MKIDPGDQAALKKRLMDLRDEQLDIEVIASSSSARTVLVAAHSQSCDQGAMLGGQVAADDPRCGYLSTSPRFGQEQLGLHRERPASCLLLCHIAHAERVASTFHITLVVLRNVRLEELAAEEEHLVPLATHFCLLCSSFRSSSAWLIVRLRSLPYAQTTRKQEQRTRRRRTQELWLHHHPFTHHRQLLQCHHLLLHHQHHQHLLHLHLHLHLSHHPGLQLQRELWQELLYQQHKRHQALLKMHIGNASTFLPKAEMKSLSWSWDTPS